MKYHERLSNVIILLSKAAVVVVVVRLRGLMIGAYKINNRAL